MTEAACHLCGDPTTELYLCPVRYWLGHKLDKFHDWEYYACGTCFESLQAGYKTSFHAVEIGQRFRHQDTWFEKVGDGYGQRVEDPRDTIPVDELELVQLGIVLKP